jgi:hypothetical protein
MEFYTIEVNGKELKTFKTELLALNFIKTLDISDKIIIWLEEYPADFHGCSDAHGYKTKVFVRN